MVKDSIGLQLYQMAHEDVSKVYNKKAWEELSDGEQEKFTKQTARKEIEHFWEIARKHKVSGWGLYLSAKNKDMNEKGGTLNFTERSAHISASWRELSDSEKSKWGAKADEINKANGVEPVVRSKKAEKEEGASTVKKTGKKAAPKEGKIAEKKGEKKPNGKRKDPESEGTKKKPSLKKKKVSDDEDDE